MTANAQMHEPLPGATSTFLTDLQTWLLNEEALRYVDMFTPFVVSGGVISPTAGLTATPSALVAYPGGYYATETGAITFPNNATSWVVMTYAIDSALTGSFARVAGTKYAIDSVSVTQPTAPANSVYLAKVVTSGGAITTVTDLRPLSPLAAGTYSITQLTAKVYVDTCVTLPYAATITPDASAGSWQTVTATDATVFAFAAPTNAVVGQRLTLTLRNTSGGTLGGYATRWNSIYKLATWTDPVNGYSNSITFGYDGTNWIELSRTPDDVPN